jgi:hypothetical protein
MREGCHQQRENREGQLEKILLKMVSEASRLNLVLKLSRKSEAELILQK